MALSDQLAKLSAQAKSLEDSAAATEAKDKAKVAARKAEVEAKLNAAKAEAQAEGKADADDVAAGWQKLRAKVSGDFDTLRENAGKRHATHQAKHADRRADNAECDAEDAIEFAIYALEEAEYYVLAAAEARVEAVDAELNAEIKNAE
ncbi:hypothetical protein MINS_04290 [Mycolicibacterium insubricum]|uniref:Uncharacterized protein n=1 Tax=Mycolicibacterium insubricum TaxID=444597 RepID=A0A1X0CZE3_9MYCO|nr:hypothetical protein [Mycolicibacterium insubricum]MCB9439290.1 hypothetical protein [Mycolicibacterium sp.]MCV7081181.1 hypothetical protein [Mycolicibacterium insubricum]ORA64870.1 hypothetical protein BST26_19610 [Mycolicibacterium insubricum]BBZ65000.1 hypothetical protein MINS_04290 [Mycolicibacterium insubricum]